MSSTRQTMGSFKPHLVAVLFLSYAVAASASAGMQFSQPVGQPGNILPQGTFAGNGGYFSKVVTPISSGAGQEGQPTNTGSLPVTVLPGDTDVIYSLQGSLYMVFSISGPGQGASPLALQSPAVLSVWAAQANRRSRFRIYIEILDVLKAGPLTPFEIAFRLRLNSKRAKGYVDHLVQKGLLKTEEEKDLVSLTASGLGFADEIRKALLID